MQNPSQPANRNRTYIIIAVVVVLLLCCCCLVAVGGWYCGDMLMGNAAACGL
jgi:hypothetical protein